MTGTATNEQEEGRLGRVSEVCDWKIYPKLRKISVSFPNCMSNEFKCAAAQETVDGEASG